MRKTDDILWKSPVRVRIGHGSTEAVRGPREALEYLNWRWPVRHGTYYLRALRDCAAGLQQTLPLDLARETFMLASIEAEMLD